MEPGPKCVCFNSVVNFARITATMARSTLTSFDIELTVIMDNSFGTSAINTADFAKIAGFEPWRRSTGCMCP